MFSFDYTICPSANNQEFITSCRKIEKHFGLQKHTPIIDVDGSAVQVYEIDGKTIRIDIDFLIDAVFVQSNMDLSNLFN